MSSPVLRFGQLRIFYGPEKTDSTLLKTAAIATGTLVAASFIFTAGVWAGYQLNACLAEVWPFDLHQAWPTASPGKAESDEDSSFDFIRPLETNSTQGIRKRSCNHSSTGIVPQGIFQIPSATLLRDSNAQAAFLPVPSNDDDTDRSTNDSFDRCSSSETTPRVINSALTTGTTPVRVINASQILMVQSLPNLRNVSSSGRGSDVVFGNRSVAGSSAPDLLFTREPSAVAAQELERHGNASQSNDAEVSNLRILPLANQRNFRRNFAESNASERSAVNSFSTVSSCSNASTAQIISDEEYIMVNVRIDSGQSSSGENTERRSHRSPIDNFSGAASSTESIPLVSPRTLQINQALQE